MSAERSGFHLFLALLAPLRQVTGQHAREWIRQFGRSQPFYDPGNFTESAPGRFFVGQQCVDPLSDDSDHRLPGNFAKAYQPSIIAFAMSRE